MRNTIKVIKQWSSNGCMQNEMKERCRKTENIINIEIDKVFRG